MSQLGGKDSKRHFTVVIRDKEHGLYVSSTPSSAARKAVTKLCASNKSKKVEFHIREITQGSKKKIYGPYLGHIEKLKEPIELKGRVIKYKPIAKLIRKKSVKKGGMFPRSQGGPARVPAEGRAKIESICIHDRNNEGGIDKTLLRLSPDKDEWVNDRFGNNILLEKDEEVNIILQQENSKGEAYLYVTKKINNVGGFVKAKYIKCSNPGIKCIHDRENKDFIETTMLRLFPDENKWAIYDGNPIVLAKGEKVIVTATNIKKNPQAKDEYYSVIKNNNTATRGLVKAEYIKCSNSRVQLPNINSLLQDSQNPSTNWTSSFQPSYGSSSQSAILPGLRGHSANLSGFSGQSATLPGLRGHSANLSIESDRLLSEVLADQQSEGGRIERVSNDKYILHINDNYRKIIERVFLNNNRNFSQITFQYETGPIIKTEGYFDTIIHGSIRSRMKTSETNLEDLLKLCSDTYKGMFHTDIPPKKLDELKQFIMTNPIRQKGQNPIFYKQ